MRRPSVGCKRLALVIETGESPSWGITILGDDLYCKQPLCEAILAQGMSFILVCKPDSHTTLYEWVEGLEVTDSVKTVTVTRRKGKRVKTDTYRFCNNVPLRDGNDALEVNWCELTTRDADGKIVYKNAFATNHEIDEENVVEIVRAGRARWKVENENNNTLKTKGYHLTHVNIRPTHIQQNHLVRCARNRRSSG